MDDDVRELTVKCAEVVGLAVGPFGSADGSMVWACDDRAFRIGDQFEYDPATDPAQAFELLCWLASRGRITITKWHLWFSIPAEIDLEYDAQSPTELRLAIMRAVCKVKEGQ